MFRRTNFTPQIIAGRFCYGFAIGLQLVCNLKPANRWNWIAIKGLDWFEFLIDLPVSKPRWGCRTLTNWRGDRIIIWTNSRDDIVFAATFGRAWFEKKALFVDAKLCRWDYRLQFPWLTESLWKWRFFTKTSHSIREIGLIRPQRGIWTKNPAKIQQIRDFQLVRLKTF